MPAKANNTSRLMEAYSVGRAFQRTGAWRVNDLSVILSRQNCGAFESDSGRGTSASVVLDMKDRADRRACEIEVFCGR